MQRLLLDVAPRRMVCLPELAGDDVSSGRVNSPPLSPPVEQMPFVPRQGMIRYAEMRNHVAVTMAEGARGYYLNLIDLLERANDLLFQLDGCAPVVGMARLALFDNIRVLMFQMEREIRSLPESSGGSPNGAGPDMSVEAQRLVETIRIESGLIYERLGDVMERRRMQSCICEYLGRARDIVSGRVRVVTAAEKRCWHKDARVLHRLEELRRKWSVETSLLGGTSLEDRVLAGDVFKMLRVDLEGCRLPTKDLEKVLRANLYKPSVEAALIKALQRLSAVAKDAGWFSDQLADLHMRASGAEELGGVAMLIRALQGSIAEEKDIFWFYAQLAGPTAWVPGKLEQRVMGQLIRALQRHFAIGKDVCWFIIQLTGLNKQLNSEAEQCLRVPVPEQLLAESRRKCFEAVLSCFSTTSLNEIYAVLSDRRVISPFCRVRQALALQKRLSELDDEVRKAISIVEDSWADLVTNIGEALGKSADDIGHALRLPETSELSDIGVLACSVLGHKADSFDIHVLTQCLLRGNKKVTGYSLNPMIDEVHRRHGPEWLRERLTSVISGEQDLEGCVRDTEIHLYGYDRQIIGLVCELVVVEIEMRAAAVEAGLLARLRARANSFQRVITQVSDRGLEVLSHGRFYNSFYGDFKDVDGSEFCGVFKPELPNRNVEGSVRMAIQGIDLLRPRFSERSVMASRLDRALGFNVIVRTDFARLNQKDGGVVRGIVMEMAEGWLGGSHDYLAFGDLCVHSANFQKDMTALLLEDNLSFQCDRHANNYFVLHDNHVKGIDNDVCFGVVEKYCEVEPGWDVHYPPSRKSALVGPPRVIDVGQLAALRGLTDEVLLGMSADLLSAREQRALIARVHAVRNFYEDGNNFLLVDGRNGRKWGSKVVFEALRDYHNSYIGRDMIIFGLQPLPVR